MHIRRYYDSISTTTGSDRQIKLVLFIFRNFKCYLDRTNFNLEQQTQIALKIDRLLESLSDTRKILRWSRAFYLAQVVYMLFEKIKTSNEYKLGEIINLYSKFNFMLLILFSDINDFVIWLMSRKILNMNKKLLDLNLKIYLIECLYWLSNYLTEYYSLRQSEDKKKKKLAKLNSIRYFLDVIVSYSYIYPQNKYVINAAGLSSGLIGFYCLFL